MICERCISREDCRKRKRAGRHLKECGDYFPDLKAARQPEELRTPEDLRQRIETR